MKPAGRRVGFTLIELLTVIAIIAILVAIIFPVMASMRKRAQVAQCISNMRQIQQALKMYKDTFGVYPEHLLGYRASNTCDPAPVAPDVTFLYPNFVKSLAIFRCPNSPFPADPPSFAGARLGGPSGLSVPGKCFPRFDSYDGQFVPIGGGYELHYWREWQPWTGVGSPNLRQLIFRNPSDETVVTWCLYHAGFTGDTPRAGEMAQVLFLDGRVKSIPAQKLTDWTQVPDHNWQVNPGN
ncbi:MAG: prepilin-type N-terminal cleavage/methylation domain-containing protein [Armatimonadetes bacterium]|nr:prepilin-type N-terminal cleavage/methylation domain-containing protein [Armatimonadota bacterium]